MTQAASRALNVAFLVVMLVASSKASCCTGMSQNSLGVALTQSSETYVDHVYVDPYSGVSQ